MLDNEEDIAIVRSTIELGHNLGLRVVAEGIEKKKELEILKSFGCDQGQGFLISHALNTSDLEQWIELRNSGAENVVNFRSGIGPSE